MISCSQCGAERLDDAKFCHECGARYPAKEDHPVQRALGAALGVNNGFTSPFPTLPLTARQVAQKKSFPSGRAWQVGRCQLTT